MDELVQMKYGDDDDSDSGPDDVRQPTSRVNSVRNSGGGGGGKTGSSVGIASAIYGAKTQQQSAATPRAESAADFAERCKHIPMRLTEEERKLLAVLENALDVCEYTDVVDVTFSHTRKNKHARIIESLVDVLSISCGLLMSNNLTKGKHMTSVATRGWCSVTMFTSLPLFFYVCSPPPQARRCWRASSWKITWACSPTSSRSAGGTRS